MAEKLKREDQEVAGGTAVGDIQRITGEKYRAAIAEINRHKAEAAEASGRARAAAKNTAELHGLDGKALKFVAGLKRMEEQKAEAVVREVLLGARWIGLFRQPGMLGDDAIAVMREIVNGVDQGIDVLPVDPKTAGESVH